MTTDRTDTALAEVQRTIVNLGDTTDGGIFDRMTLDACAKVVGEMRAALTTGGDRG